MGDTGSYGANTFLATLNYIIEPFGIITKETIPGFSGAQVIIGIVLNAQFINFN